MRKVKHLTILIVLATGAAAWLLSTGVQNVHTGIAAWALFAALAVLLTVYSIRTRWYLHGLVRRPRQDGQDDPHANLRDDQPGAQKPAYVPASWPCCPPRPRM